MANLVFVLLPAVVLQVGELGKGLLTVGALERLGLVVDGLPVSCHQDVTEESQAASLADEVEDAAVSSEVVSVKASLPPEFFPTFVALMFLELVVEVVSMINALLPSLERFVTGVASKIANFWFVARLRVRVLAVVFVQLRLVRELGAARWTKMKLPVLVEEGDVIFQRLVSVE